jgi:chorismate mutase
MWLGARTTINPFLVQEIASALEGSGARVLLKNPVAPDTGLWVGAVERMRAVGIKDIILIHRGFVAREKGKYRNDPMWQVLLEIRHELPDVPIVCDPSHIAGDRALVPEIAQMAMDLGLDGLMIECHPNPEVALSDAAQQLSPSQLSDLLSSLVVRSADSADEKFRSAISALRTQIDAVDAEIIDALARRVGISRQMGQLKKENNISIVQAERWDVVLGDVLSRAAASGLDKKLVEDIFALIHADSVKQQQ